MKTIILFLLPVLSSNIMGSTRSMRENPANTIEQTSRASSKGSEFHGPTPGHSSDEEQLMIDPISEEVRALKVFYPKIEWDDQKAKQFNRQLEEIYKRHPDVNGKPFSVVERAGLLEFHFGN